MPSETSVVLPDSLISELVTQIGDISKTLQEEVLVLNARREDIRSMMKNVSSDFRLGMLPGFIYPVLSEPEFQIHAIDGAHIAKSDRGAAYSLSCVVGLSPSGQISRHRICTAVMPHFIGLSSISSGFMTMQEIMMTVELAEASPNSLILIDGSRLSSFIAINQFYEAIIKDGLDTLRKWREGVVSDNIDGPSVVIGDFESRDWMTPFLSLPNIVGNLKLVTTKSLIKKYARDLLHRFDDQAMANTVLELGEGTIIHFDHSDEKGQKLPPLHITNISGVPEEDRYPFTKEAERSAELLHSPGPDQLIHLYAKVNPMHGVYKIEFNRGLLTQKGLGAGNKEILQKLIQWWGWNTAAIDIMEPYPSFVADRFVSEAVKVSEIALRDILVRESETDTLWNLSKPYRT